MHGAGGSDVGFDHIGCLLLTTGSSEHAKALPLGLVKCLIVQFEITGKVLTHSRLQPGYTPTAMGAAENLVTPTRYGMKVAAYSIRLVA